MKNIVFAEIRVHPLVKKFIVRHHQGGYLPVSYDHSPFSSFLRACLERYQGQKIPKGYDKLTQTMQVGITDRCARELGSDLSPIKVLHFNNFVKQTFYMRLMMEVELRIKYGASTFDAIRAVLDYYDLSEDEMSFDTARRFYSRAKSSQLEQAV